MARMKIDTNLSYDDVRKKYYVTLYYGTNESGKPIRESKSFDTEKEARTALVLFETEKARNNVVTPRQTTFGEWLDYWLEDVVRTNLEETTQYGYGQMIKNHIKPILGDTPLQKLTPKHLQQYYSLKMRGSKPLSANTVNKHHGLIATALKFAVTQDAILKSPADKVSPPRARIKEKSAYSPDQLLALYNAVNGDRLEIVVKLAGYLGMRREEICGLRWDNVDIDRRIIRICEVMTSAGSKIVIKPPKTKTSIRTLSFPEDVLTVLLREKQTQVENKAFFKNDYQDGGYVVQWPDGRPYRPNYLSELFTGFIIKHGFPKIVLHDLRHSFASIANLKGVTLFDISRALGHSRPDTTGKIYTHLFDKSHSEIVEKVSDAISDAGK